MAAQRGSASSDGAPSGTGPGRAAPGGNPEEGTGTGLGRAAPTVQRELALRWLDVDESSSRCVDLVRRAPEETVTRDE